jgi:modulator of FtsH protease HflC
MKNLGTVLLSLIVVLLVISMATFTVDQREYALVFRLGEIVSVKKNPGLNFKWPFVDNVLYLDNRIVTLDWVEPARFGTSEKKNVLVDSFVKWRIIDPVKYYVSFKGDEVLAENRLSTIVNSGLYREFGKRTVHDVISGERSRIMEIMRLQADHDLRPLGIQVLDVRLKHVDFTPEISDSVYQRMEAERKRAANQLRSEGAGASEKIRADADKQREVIIAEAFREAQRIKGEGDAKASETYAKAYSKNPEFYAFYRSLEAYRNSFRSKSDVLVLEPNSDFFKYMRDPSGRK